MDNWSWYNFLLVWLSGFGILAAAYNMAVIGSTLGQPTFYSTLGLQVGSSHTTTVTSTANGIYYAGSFVSCIALTLYGDRLGRKKTIWITLFFLIVGSAIQTGTKNVPMYQVSRVITGIGSGGLFSTVPVYQSEISPPHFRGFLVGQAGIFSAVGYSLAAWVGYGCFFRTSGTFGFRFPIAMGCILGLIMLVVSMFLPESPRWLIENGHEEKGTRLLARLHPDSDPQHSDRFAKLETYEILKQQELDSALRHAEGRFGIITKKANLQRLFVSSFILWSSQAMGILVINNYSVSLYNSLGYTGGDALLLSAGWISTTIPFNAIAPFLIDRMGRKTMFLIGSFFLCVAVAGEGAVLKKFTDTGNTSYAKGGIFFLYFFAFTYGTFIDAASWVYAAEVWPNHRRSGGNGIAFAILYLSTITWTQSAPTGFANIGWKFYMVFVANSFLCFTVVLFFYPETRNLPLEEIPKLFGESIATEDINAIQDHPEKIDFEMVERREKLAGTHA